MKKHLKTLLMSMACIFVSQVASAQDLYFGGTVGVGAIDTKYRAFNTVTSETATAHGGGTSFVGGGLIGVEHTFCNSLYAAIEARVLYDDLSRNIRSHTTAAGVVDHRVHIKNDFIYGGDFKLGMTLDCCVTPYALVGVEAGKWRTKIVNDSATSSFGLAAGSTLTYSKTRCAPKVGLGVRFPICDILAADMQYSYTWFGRVNRSLTDPVTGDLWHNRSHVDQHKFMVSLNYAFSFMSWL